jgi:hypothetical protein
MSKRGYIIRYLSLMKRIKARPYSTYEELRDFMEREIEFLQMQDDTLSIGFSKRTLQRDLREIRNLFGIDIEYSKSEKGYYISNVEGENMNLQRQLEAFDLFNSLNMAKDLQRNDIWLTDGLYIKMNARGKALTDFENFKARFENHVKQKEFENDLSLTECNKERWKELTEKTFSHKIDTVWTDLFWKHRSNDNTIDSAFVKFIAGIAINSYAGNHEIYKSEEEDLKTREFLKAQKKKNEITDEAVKRERIERRITLLCNNPGEITPDDFPSKATFQYLKKCFDVYSNVIPHPEKDKIDKKLNKKIDNERT